MASRRVCVIGATGRVGSWLVKKLLERGHVVQATIRSLSDPEKMGMLKSLPGGDSRLHLFEADLFQPHQLEQAIQGCEFVFLVAFPTRSFRDDSEREAVSEAVLATVQSIVSACERSGTVSRLIYTGSVSTASVLHEDGVHCKDIIDESCWTQPDAPIFYPNDFAKFYVSIKTASEKLLMSYGDRGAETSVKVVVLTVGWVGGDAIVDSTFGVGEVFSPLTGDTARYGNFVCLQNLLLSAPLVHLDDACEAHIFCMDVPLTSGRRFLCASAYPSLLEVIAYYRLKYPDLLVINESEESLGRRVGGGSTRLRDVGFEYKYGMEQILDDTVLFAKKLGLLKRD